MRFAGRLGFLWVASIVVVPGCGNGAGGVPSAALVADPEVCDVPCEVVIDSGVALGGEVLTFTWDFGDGPVEGTVRAFHIFETAGMHAVSVTVSDGQSSTTDTVTVQAAVQPKTSGDIDEGGGAVSHGACTVTVPGGIAAEAFTVEVTELPSMELASEWKFDAERFEALGSAFDVSMLLKANTAMDMAVKAPEAEGAGPSDLAWLVRRLGRPHPQADELESNVSPALIANYMLLPVTRVDADGTAHGDIYGRMRAQLVRMAEPLDAERVSAEAGLSTKVVASPLLVTSFAHAPTKLSRQEFQAAIREGINRSHDFFVLAKDYRGPEAIVVSVTKLKPGTAGTVDVEDHDLIELSNAIPTVDQVKKAVAHEYFHLIQNINRNRASGLFYYDQDGWFVEGTAAWAMDEVFDEMPSLDDYYYAPKAERFWKPLLKLSNQPPRTDTYQTVAFWKWAEAKNAGIIKLIIEDQFVRTHKTLPGAEGPIENLQWVDFLTSFKTLWAGADFLEFVYNARYVKDFDTEEIKPRELWSSHEGTTGRLGAPKQVITEADTALARRTDIAPQSWGDAESNPALVEFELLPHLSAHVTRLRSFDLTGTLHVRFPKTQVPVDARVIIIDAKTKELIESSTVRDLSKERGDVTHDFDPGKEAIVFVVDPQWSYPPSTTKLVAAMKAWVVDRCGTLPSNVIDVSDEDELYAALTTAPAGSAIRLSAGSFAPTATTWTLPNDGGEWPAHVLAKDVTLAGAGKDQTTIAIRGDEFSSVGLTTYGNVTLRDLTIDAGAFAGVTAIAAKDLTLCNVDVQTYGGDGLYFNQWSGNGDGFLGIYNSSLTFGGSERHTGMDLYCEEQSGNLGVEILNSEISGWYIGVGYTNYSDSSCAVSLATDCQGFSDNELANVMHVECTPPDCTEFVEECP